MLHERLRQRLIRQRAELRSGKYIEALGEDMKALLQDNAPSQTGNLVGNLTATSGIKENTSGFRIGFGSRSRIGISNIGAPRGTIKQFLDDYPQFKRNWSLVRSAARAWWALPAEGKELLQQERLAGNYGGIGAIGVGKSPYLYPQEGSFSSWEASAGKANIRPTKFVNIAVNEWRYSSVPRVMRLFAKNMGLT